MHARPILILISAALYGGELHSASSGATLDEAQAQGRRIVDEAIAALGGQKFLSIRDSVGVGWESTRHGEVVRHVRTRIYARYADPAEPDAPDSAGVLERHTYNKDESHAVLYTEAGGYEITFRGVRPLSREQVARFREDSRRNVLHILRQRLDEPGLILEYRGPLPCQNQSADVVDITDTDNVVITVCFNRTTRLPIRQSYYRRDPETKEKIEEVTLFSRFAEAGDGVLWPRLIEHQRDGEMVWALFLETVSINQGLDKNLFALPKDMTLLGRPDTGHEFRLVREGPYD